MKGRDTIGDYRHVPSLASGFNVGGTNCEGVIAIQPGMPYATGEGTSVSCTEDICHLRNLKLGEHWDDECTSGRGRVRTKVSQIWHQMTWDGSDFNALVRASTKHLGRDQLTVQDALPV